MDLKVASRQNPENQQICLQSAFVTEGQKDEPSTVQKKQTTDAKGVESKVSAAASVVLEGIDAALVFPQKTGNEGSLTFQWEGNKDILQSDGFKSEGSISFSQAHSLVEVLQELFRPSGSPLQIVLESQNVEETLYERSGNLVTTKLAPKETNINMSNVTSHSHEITGSDIVNEIQCSKNQGNDQDNLKKCDALSTFHLIHKCCYCHFRSETVTVVLDHVKKKHPGKQAKTKAISGRDCPYCGLRLDQTAFFQHMRQFHEDSHPYRCGYCNFMARDLNQLKHHCTKKHRDEPFKAFRRLVSESHDPSSTQNRGISERSIPPNADATDADSAASKNAHEAREASSEKKGEKEEMIESLGNTLQKCPICHKKVKTLKYLKVHMRVHNKGRYKCGYCSYISAYCLQVLLHCKKRHRHLQPRVKQHELDPLQDKNIVKNYDMFMEEVKKKCSKQPPDPDIRKWARKYSCPSCEYTCNYGASYRRHLTTHSNSPLPFRCYYCPFEGREKYYVRRHIQRIHRGCSAVVVENNGGHMEKVPGDLKKSVPLLSTSLRTVESQIRKKLPKDLVKIKNCTQKPEVATLVSAPAGEVSSQVQIEETMKDGRNDALSSRSSEVRLSSDVNGDNVETNYRANNILRPNECLSLNAPRGGKDSKENSLSPKFSEGIKIRAVKACNSQKATKTQSPKPTQSILTHQYVNEGATGILPVQATITGFSADIKVNDTVEKDNEGIQEAIIPDGLIPERESGGINLVNLLDVVNEDNCDDFAVQSVQGMEENDVTLQNSKCVDDNQAKSVAIKAAKKKGSKEKSSHKAWDFVAYRDGRYTYCVCGTRTVNKAFYKHIKKHVDSKRFACGYCSYRSIERAKVRVHHTFVHPGLPLSVNEDEAITREGFDGDPLKQTQVCSVQDAKGNQQSNLKKESSSSSRLSPLFQCPICKKKISYHSFTIRRHLFSHCDYRPYKCGRCDFRGCTPGEVKQHSVFHGADLCPVVEPSGQQPPEGLEQLVTDCFNELHMKLGKKIRRRSKSNGKLIPPIGEHMEKEVLNPSGYQLVTSEASIWSQSLSNGVCPWCQFRIPSSLSSTEQLMKESGNGCIRSHFKDHFYKPVEDAPNECQVIENGSSIPAYPTGSLEEKDTIVMNGLMYYFINQPLMKESYCQVQKNSHGDQLDAFKGEIGIINNPDGMPPGTIQVTDFLLADLRHLLWGNVNESKSRKAQWHTCQQCKQQFRSYSALQHHSKSHADNESVGILEEEKQCDFQKQSTTDTVLQGPEGEVGVFLLGDDVEVATAVVVINSEAEEREMVLEVSS